MLCVMGTCLLPIGVSFLENKLSLLGRMFPYVTQVEKRYPVPAGGLDCLVVKKKRTPSLTPNDGAIQWPFCAVRLLPPYRTLAAPLRIVPFSRKIL